MMKDIFVGQLKDVHALNNDKNVSNGQIVAYRSGNHIEIQNLNASPDVLLEFDRGNNSLVISIPLNEGDFVVLQDRSGIAEKREIQ